MDWSTLPRARLTRIERPYVEQGKGETVVLVHGSNSDHRIWDRHRPIIASGCRVIAVSQRYFHITDTAGDEESVAGFAGQESGFV